jgi:phasin family protein
MQFTVGNYQSRISIPPLLEKIMFHIQDQISVATRNNLESQLAMFTELTNKTFESVRKLVSLNLTAAKASLQESTVTAKQLMAAKDPQEFFSLTAAQAQPNIGKALAYSRHLANIASGTQAEFAKAAEAQIVEVNRNVTRLIEDVAKNAPVGSENVIALMKSTIESATGNYEQLSRTTKETMGAMEANLNTVANQFAAAK